MHKLFIDSDVVLDVFAKRHPFYDHSARLLAQIEKNNALGFTSPLVFANLHYILRKLKSKDYALKSLRRLRLLIQILTLDAKSVDQALNSDFEDGIQYYAAKKGGMNFIITRNKKDFKESSITVCTPEEYLAILETQNKGNHQ